MNSIAEPRFRLPLAALALAGLALLLWACHLKEPAPQTVLSLGVLADSLDEYEEILVVLRDAETGDSLETLFRGRVEDRGDLVDLPTMAYQGGRVVIAITGWREGRVVYRVDRVYDGRAVEGVLPRLVPGARVDVASSDVEIRVGDDAPLPSVTVSPADLTDKSVEWTSSDSGKVSLAGGRYRGEAQGTAQLTAALRADPSRKASFMVYVKPRVLGAPPESLVLRPDTLEVALKGRARAFTLEVHPATAERAVTWHAADVEVARITSTGQVEPVGAGLIRAWAVSAADRRIVDTAWIRVTAEVAVTRVDIVKDLISLVRGGAPESLAVQVEPLLADPAVELSVKDGNIARVEGGKVYGQGEGDTWVYAVSERDPSKRDSARVTVGEPRRIDSVAIARDTLLLWLGGPARNLDARVHPEPGKVIWSSSDPAKASVDTLGRVSPGSEAGNAVIRATSRHDTAKYDEVAVSVRRPQIRLDVGRDDTTVAVKTLVAFRPRATVDFGGIALFEWDLDGDGKLEGESKVEKEVAFTYPEAKEYSARFLVRDSLGNTAEFIKKVKAVTGRAVNIVEPRNGLITRERVVKVAWTVDGAAQSDRSSDTLKARGANVIRRSAEDEAGKVYRDSVIVYWDTLPPAKPTGSGSVPAGGRTATWRWSSGGNGGHGIFRSRVDTAALDGLAGTRDTLRIAANLPDGAHTLYVQERDSAGNWSETAALAVTVDATPPGAPVVTTRSAVTNQPPHWGWKSGGQGSGTFRWSLDPTGLAAATPGTDTTFTGAATLADGTHTLYVQERDAAGNWSAPGSLAVRLDRVKPGKPVFPAGLLSPMNQRNAAWVWTPGGGGNGTYRYSLNVNNPTEETRTARFALPSGLPEGNHTLYVQERDTAGNWSDASSRTLYMTVRDTVGTPNFSGGTRSLDFAFSPGGVAHVALSDEGLEGKVSVLRYSGGTWTPHAGNETGFPRTSAWPIGSLTFNGSAPMVSYQNGMFVSTKTYTSGAWRFLGDSIIAVQSSVGPTVANGTGKYYALATDGRSGTVMIDTLALGAWGATPPTGFTASIQIGDTADYRGGRPDMDLAPNGSLYVTFRDRADRSRPKVLLRSATGWTNISTGLPQDSASTLSMAIGPDNTPYLVISASTRLSAWVYRNGTWSALGNLGALGGGAMAAIAIGEAGIPYVAHPSIGESNRVAVRAYVNNAWTTVARGLSPAGAQQVRIAVHPTGDVPWVAYTLPANGRKVTVVKAAYEPPAP